MYTWCILKLIICTAVETIFKHGQSIQVWAPGPNVCRAMALSYFNFGRHTFLYRKVYWLINHTFDYKRRSFNIMEQLLYFDYRSSTSTNKEQKYIFLKMIKKPTSWDISSSVFPFFSSSSPFIVETFSNCSWALWKPDTPCFASRLD